MSSSLEGNKIAAAVLTAGVIAMATGFLAHILYGSEEMTENAYMIQVPDTSTAGMAGEAAQEEPLAVLLASADLAAGEKQAKKCAACHSFDQGGPDKIGPNLWEILDNGIANNAAATFTPMVSNGRPCKVASAKARHWFRVMSGLTICSSGNAKEISARLKARTAKAASAGVGLVTWSWANEVIKLWSEIVLSVRNCSEYRA